MVAGILFVTGALLKPWPSPAKVPHLSPSQIAAVEPSATISGPAPIDLPNIAPGNFRGPFQPMTTPVPAAALVGVGPTYSWSTVDWSALDAQDRHAGWGFAAAVMAGGAGGLDSPSALTPTTTWVTLGSPPVYSAVPLVQTRGVYAIALTWPSDVQVRRVSFQYLGGPQHPAYLPPASFLPNSPLIPLRASSVSSASPAPGIAGHAIRSGEFLIPPTAAAPNPANRALAAAWRTSPWLWPYGAYQVTVTSATGTTRVILDLMLTD